MIAVRQRPLELPFHSRTAIGAGQLVVVMLGSNIDPEHYLPEAVRELAALGEIEASSSVWQTAPIGYTEQADFCNAAVSLRTSLSVRDLLKKLRSIEDQLGRVRDPRNKNAPRTIDLDLAVIPGPPRIVAGKMFPDPDLSERVFLAVPLAEVLPGFTLTSGHSISAVAQTLEARDGARLRLQRRSDIRLP